MKKDLANKILSDLRVELLDEFGRNFERKAFFDQPWEKRKRNGRGSLLLVSGQLRRSIAASISKNSIRFSSNTPYADIHNKGGTIVVSPKMRKYFWYRYIKAKDPEAKIPAKGSDAEFWAAMARTPKINIPARPFIGNHPKVREIAHKVANECVKEHLNNMFSEFANKTNK